jgi:hypothetical protein
VCDGVSTSCANAFRPATYACNTAVSGLCDAPDYCTGNSAHCPAEFLSGVVCRDSRAACELPETCAGTSVDCPPDDVVPAGIVCRASVNTACDPAEVCDGTAFTCPANFETCP